MSTQTQSGSATVTPGYDPSYSPYTAPTTPPPEITAPPPHAQEDTRQSQTPSLIGGKGAGITKIATVVDSILKGAMRGRDYANQVKAYKQQRLAQGLNYNYQTARNNYLGMLKSGADPNSKEVQEAKSAADAAWQVQQQFYQNMFGQQDGKGKGNKSKSKQSTQGGNDPHNPLVMWASNDPVDKLRAAVMIRQKVGPDYTGEAAMYTSPEYQRQLKLMRGDQALAEGLTEDKLNLRNLEMADTSKMSPDEKSAHDQKITALRDRIGEATSGYSQRENIIDKKTTPDNHRWVLWQDAQGKTRWEDQGEQRQLASQIAKPGSEQAFIEAVAKENGIDSKQLSAQSLLDLQRAWKESGEMGRTVGRYYVYTDARDGKIHAIQLTTTTTPPAASVPNVTSATPPNPTSGTTASTPPKTHEAHATHNRPTSKGVIGSDTVIGETLSKPQAKSQATVNDTYKKMKPLFGLLDAQEQYMNEVKSDPSKATPRQDLSLVVAAVRSMNPGSVRLPQKELELEMKAGSLGDQARRWYEKAATGLLPDDQRNDLFTIVQRETTKAGESIAADWKQYMSGQPLPNDIKRFGKDNVGSGNGAGASGPDTHETPEQKQLLDKFFPSPSAPQPK